MLKFIRTSLFLSLCILAWTACHTPQSLVKKDFESTQLNSRNPEDSVVVQMISPYKAVLDQSMQEIVGHLHNTLSKEAPEGSLNNFIADALLETAIQSKPAAIPVACVLNMGGIRLNELPAGDLTVGKCFELLPFENKLVVITISGSQLQELLDLVASNKGWPLAGIRMQMQGGKAVAISIQGKPIELKEQYSILTNDYMANGGDNCAMLSRAPQIALSSTMRDAFINYCRSKNAKNQPINAVKDGRIK